MVGSCSPWPNMQALTHQVYRIIVISPFQTHESTFGLYSGLSHLAVWKRFWSYSEWVNIALRRFLHNHGNIAAEGSRSHTLIECLQGNFRMYSTIDSTAHCRLLNSLKHFICTAARTNIRPGRDSNPAPLSFKPQPGRMSHRGRPDGHKTGLWN